MVDIGIVLLEHNYLRRWYRREQDKQQAQLSAAMTHREQDKQQAQLSVAMTRREQDKQQAQLSAAMVSPRTGQTAEANVVKCCAASAVGRVPRQSLANLTR